MANVPNLHLEIAMEWSVDLLFSITVYLSSSWSYSHISRGSEIVFS